MRRLTFLLGWFLLAWSVDAVIMTPLSIEELTSRAKLIVHGTVLKKSCQRDPAGRIYTKVELDMKEVWKGSAGTRPLIIVHSGGTLGDERVDVSGQVEYAAGEEVVTFLVWNERGEAVTLGLAQGKFHVWKDAASGQVCVRNPFHGADPAARATNKAQSRSASESLTLSSLKARVKGEEK